MSIITLQEVKQDLHITHDADDALLQVYLDACEDEALQFMDRSSWLEVCECVDTASDAVSEPLMPPSVRVGVLLLVRAKYDSADPAIIEPLRKAAETILMPFRCRYGV